VTKVAAVTTETIAAVLRPVTLVAVGKRLTAAGEIPLFKFDPRILAGESRTGPCTPPEA
jgi:hypothetical protein